MASRKIEEEYLKRLEVNDRDHLLVLMAVVISKLTLYR